MQQLNLHFLNVIIQYSVNDVKPMHNFNKMEW